MTEATALKTTLDAGILFVEMNRPERRNALDETLQEELLRVFEVVATNPRYAESS
jgi:enoyl-CoA hydratase/carnithine racemase